MISRLLKYTSVVLCTLTLVSCATSPDESKSVDLFRRSQAEEQLRVTGAIKGLCKDILGYEYSKPVILWQKLGDSRVWQLETHGKHGDIVSQFQISDGRITDSRIISSKERRGRQIKSRSYLRQFEGLSVGEDNSLSHRIDGITGATMSSKAVESAARLALKLDAMISSKK